MESLNGADTADSVKLFVGQVPRHMTEEQLLPIFQEAGAVRELSVIKDKATKASRGCCFLIYESKQEADNAIALFHNQRKLPPLSTPLQVKYAEGELERLEHKLFVGMLPKNVSEADLTPVFSPFGVIKELTVIKGSQASRGCAFLKYELKEQALAAIKSLNEIYKMEGSTTPLVVKWADTEKDKQARKQQRFQVVPAVPSQQPAPYGLVPGAYGVAASLNSYGYQAQNPYTLPQYPTTSLPGQSAVPGGMLGVPNAPGSVPSAGYDITSGTGSVYPNTYGATQPASYGYTTGYTGVQNVQYPAVHQTSFMPQGNTTSIYQSAGLPNVGIGSALSMVPTPKTMVLPQVEGPPGSNLFIYHLPADFGDHDLITTFQPFGNVISAKVYIDKNTGLSKCFGFVSFDAAEAAASAISTMNGAPLGGKRLKVQLKRDSRQNKPY
ncbi:hypothetical protein GOP47_0012635 [Adiantum capillus-veneris]|uniref:RRM domain-containing protein n=1 Tax=Adiantum capillus-veneris TaxID=13818 RepID=A0A9D4UR22_ADICA|nr:hypothetical protein GOP47_0012635 [Adiantum capillus-veneris]